VEAPPPAVTQTIILIIPFFTLVLVSVSADAPAAVVTWVIAVVFDAVGETVVLLQSNSEWHIIASNGVTIS
jgi:hypothetical protein